jgi:hypothetical protein
VNLTDCKIPNRSRKEPTAEDEKEQQSKYYNCLLNAIYSWERGANSGRSEGE